MQAHTLAKLALGRVSSDKPCDSRSPQWIATGLWFGLAGPLGFPVGRPDFQRHWQQHHHGSAAEVRCAPAAFVGEATSRSLPPERSTTLARARLLDSMALPSSAPTAHRIRLPKSLPQEPWKAAQRHRARLRKRTTCTNTGGCRCHSTCSLAAWGRRIAM